MTDESNDKSLIIFGKDVSKIPCFRNSYLYGIGSGLGGGLLYFMFTSNVRKACNAGMGTFALVTMSYWMVCRYNYSKTKFQMMHLQERLQTHAMYEGTATEKRREESIEFKTTDA